MDLSAELLAGISILGKIGKGLWEKWLSEKADQHCRDKELEQNIIDYSFGNKFDDYFTRMGQRASYINTVVFQGHPKRLKDLYVPLVLINENADSHIVEEYEEGFFSKQPKILVIDAAGMGKSTIAKRLFLSCLEQKNGLPMFIELRKLDEKNGIIDLIQADLGYSGSVCEKDFIDFLIDNGHFIFFFDGFDEIPFHDRDLIIRKLALFMERGEHNRFFITSRPEPGLVCFNNFSFYKIEPLKKSAAYDLIKKYDEGGTTSVKLIETLEISKVMNNVKEFLGNPLLVSLLYKSYDYKPKIQFKKHLFYRQVYDAVFENHDLTKGGAYVREKCSKLDIDDFHRVLRALGFITLKKGKVEYSKDELFAVIEDIKNNCPGIVLKTSDFIKDLTSTVPLFIIDGNYYRWAHKSIQEYFAAQFVLLDAKENQKTILLKMAESRTRDFINILDLYFDMDYQTFNDTIVFKLIEDFFAYCDTSYRKTYVNGITMNDIRRRQMAMYAKAVLLQKEEFYRGKNEKNCEWLSIIRPKITLPNVIGYETIFNVIEKKTGNRLAFTCAFNNIQSLLDLLTNKGETYVKRVKHTSFKMTTIDIVLEDVFLQIDEDPNSVCNQIDLFNVITELILARVSAYFDYELCKKHYDEIVKKSINKNENKFMLDGL